MTRPNSSAKLRHVAKVISPIAVDAGGMPCAVIPLEAGKGDVSTWQQWSSAMVTQCVFVGFGYSAQEVLASGLSRNDHAL